MSLQIEIIQIGGRQYRKAIISAPTNLHKSSTNEEENKYKQEEDEEVAPHGLDIHYDDFERKYTLSIIVDKAFLPFVVGKERANIERIKKETGAFITIPGPASIDEHVVITAEREKIVVAAKNRIDEAIVVGMNRLPYTHFISFPLTIGDIPKNFTKFKSSILENYMDASPGLDESCFIEPERLHLTILMLKLYSQEQIKKTQELFKDNKFLDQVQRILDGRPIIIEIKGLEIMGDDPSDVGVLYGKLTETEGATTLKTLCDFLITSFLQTNLISDEEIVRQRLYSYHTNEDTGIETKTLKIKFHATLINTKYREDKKAPIEIKGGSKDKRDKRKEKDERKNFDAYNILEDFKDIKLGREILSSFHLSSLCNIDTSTGYYKSEANISLLQQKIKTQGKDEKEEKGNKGQSKDWSKMVGTGVDQANNSRNSNKSEQRTKPSSSLPKSDEGQQRTTPFDQSEDQSNNKSLPKRTRPERRRQDNQGRSQESEQSDQNRRLITESLPQRSARERTQRNLPQKEQSSKEVYQPRDQGEEL